MDTLPDEILLRIFAAAIDVPLNEVCKRWNDLISNHVKYLETAGFPHDIILVAVRHHPARVLPTVYFPCFTMKQKIDLISICYSADYIKHQLQPKFIVKWKEIMEHCRAINSTDWLFDKRWWGDFNSHENIYEALFTDNIPFCYYIFEKFPEIIKGHLSDEGYLANSIFHLFGCVTRPPKYDEIIDDLEFIRCHNTIFNNINWHIPLACNVVFHL